MCSSTILVKRVVNSVPDTYRYNGNTYVRRSKSEARVGAAIAMAASALIYKALPPFSNPFLRQMKKEHANNELYKDAFIRAVDLSGLKKKGLQIQHMEFLPGEINLPREKVPNYDVKKGLNAFFSPKNKVIALNTNKASISGFHELGHAMNNMSGKFGKILQRLRGPGYWIAGIMGMIAMYSRPKPKDAPRNTMDWVQDNCAAIAVAGMLPTVAEEALASYKGIQMAKKAGLADNVIKNLKKFYSKALLSYAGYAAITGISVYAVNKIMETFTRPQKVEDQQIYY